MNRKILKKLFVIFVYIFFFRNISFGENKTIYKYFISTRATEIRSFPYETGAVIGMLNNDVRVKILGLSNNWLLADIEYANLSAKSLDDLDVHFNGWVNKKDFMEAASDEKSNYGADLKSPSILNTVYSPEDNPAEVIDKDHWEKENKFYLFTDTRSDLFLLPDIPQKDPKTAFITDKTQFTVAGNCLDWKQQEWIEIVFYSSTSGFQKFWIKKTEILSEKEKNILSEMEDSLLEIKQIENMKAENMKIEINNLKIEIEDIKKELDLEENTYKIITGKADFDKRIKEIEINNKINILEEKIKRLDLLQDSLRIFDKKM